jgi:hypothetical protein
MLVDKELKLEHVKEHLLFILHEHLFSFYTSISKHLGDAQRCSLTCFNSLHLKKRRVK